MMARAWPRAAGPGRGGSAAFEARPGAPRRRPAIALALALALAVGGATSLPREAWGDGASPVTATVAQKKRAQAKFVEGSAHFDAGRFEEAQRAFEASYAVVASPNSHLMIARSMRSRGNLVGAFEELEKVEKEARRLSESGEGGSAKYAETVEMARGDLEELKGLLGRVRVRLEGGRHAEGVRVSVGDRELSPIEREQGVVVPPGQVEVVARMPGGARKAARVEVSAGEDREVALDVAPIPSPSPSPSPSPIPSPIPSPRRSPPAPVPPVRASLAPVGVAALGVGGLGLAIFGTASLMAGASEARAAEPCPAGLLPSRCDERRARELGEAEALRAMGTLSLVAGIAGLATGGALLVVEVARKEPRGGGPRAAVALGPASVGVAGRF